MDTYRTESLTQSVRKVLNSKEPERNMHVQKSYHSYRIPSQDNRNFSIRNSMTNDDDNRSSNESLHPKLPRNIPAGVRSMSRIKYANGRSVDNTIANIKGMFALPPIRNNDALQLLSNYHTPGKHSFM